jgi:hypothetical protein
MISCLAWTKNREKDANLKRESFGPLIRPIRVVLTIPAANANARDRTSALKALRIIVSAIARLDRLEDGKETP